MNIILKSAKIIDSTSPFHNQVVDIHVKNGKIEKIAASITDAEANVIQLEDLSVSPGWFDTSVSFGEPGYEERETLVHGLEVAAKSGFTQVAIQSNNNPITDNQSIVSFIKQKAFGQTTEAFPIGALTMKSEGTDLAELYDMKNAGAVAFGDYKKAIDNANVLKIALQYVQDFDGLVLAFSQDKSVKGKGVVHEGITSTTLGLKGIPPLAEELQVARNLFLLEYTGGKLHIPTISTAKSVELIREAKAKGLHVTCSVAVHQLIFTDAKLTEFDSRHKVSPPLRDEETRQALLAGILDNTIDCITTDHTPLDIEHKKLEFDLATSGTIGLESAFGALNTVLPIEVIVDKLTAGRAIFGIETTRIAVGEIANLSLFSTQGTWTFNKENILSKSKNSAFLGTPMQGKVYGVIRQDKQTFIF
ncbi:dihydroorotase [Myroides fluvii]|uniref:dihydroorotase n=1 Tax=Myroides fluvii TaxID=2572594 RepID=UPI00131B7906|nr:dihydroorotase [Myroides fluvii]